MQNATSAARVTVLGLGLMGTAIAAHLAERGFSVRGWNRTPGRGEGLSAQGIEVLTDAAEAAAGAEIVLTMLTDGAATADVIRQARPAAGTTWAQLGTVGVQATAELSELAASQRLVLVDAPVLGTVAPARQGQLLILASGPDEARERVRPLFDALGKRTLWLGAAGRGSALKLALNTWLAAVVEGISETMALAACLDIDPATILDALDGEAVASPYALMKGRNLLAGALDPGFPLKHATKDIGMVVEAARKRGVDLPAVEATLPAWRAAVEAGGGDADIAGAGTRYGLAP